MKIWNTKKLKNCFINDNKLTNLLILLLLLIIHFDYLGLESNEIPYTCLNSQS